MANAVGRKNLLCIPQDCHKRIRRLLHNPFSMNSMSKFVQRFDTILCERLKKVQKEGKSFIVLDFNIAVQITFDVMCDMLMSIKDASLLEHIKRNCPCVSDAMLLFPVMIPNTRYYKGIKARKRLFETCKAMITSRRNGKEYHVDFLQSMLSWEGISSPADQELDDEEIMDSLLTLIIAGQTITTVAAMMWCVKFLDEHKQAQDMLRA